MANIYKMNSKVVMEKFEDAALILRLDDRNLIEVNASAAEILEHTDGHRSVVEIARIIAEQYQVNVEYVFEDVVTLYQQLTVQEIIEPVIQGES